MIKTNGIEETEKKQSWIPSEEKLLFQNITIQTEIEYFDIQLCDLLELC